MSKIVQLKKEGINEYPITIPEAVIDSNGVTVKDKLKTLEDKIENIKPGSDPYDDTEIKKQLNNKIEKGSLATINGQSIEQGGNIEIEGGASTTPDWNAAEGEAGYIKNKPFYGNADYIIDKSGEYNNVPEGDVIFYNKVLFNLRDIAYNDVIVINSGPPVTLEKRQDDYGKVVLIIEDISNYLSANPIIISNLVTIPEIFIPDTIARKSDLENIGGGGKSQFQIYKENGGSFYETEEQYNLYTVLKNDPDTDLVSSIQGPLITGDYTWEDYGITPKMIVKWIYYKESYSSEDYFYINVVDPDLDYCEKEFVNPKFGDGVIMLTNDNKNQLNIYLNGNIHTSIQ